VLDRPYHEILGVPANADRKALRKAYFALSKELPPDRFFRRNTGTFGKRLDRIFGKIVEAYELLSDPTARAEIERSLAAAAGQPAAGRRCGGVRRRRARDPPSRGPSSAEEPPRAAPPARVLAALAHAPRASRRAKRSSRPAWPRTPRALHRGRRWRAPRDRVRSVERDLQGALRRRASARRTRSAP
jgi:curved DNA-binding protein CbpA